MGIRFRVSPASPQGLPQSSWETRVRLKNSARRGEAEASRGKSVTVKLDENKEAFLARAKRMKENNKKKK